MRQTQLKSVCLAALLLLASLAGATVSRAEQIVIPGSLAAAEGNSSDISWGLFGVSPTTTQIQITADELSALGLSSGEQITGVRQRRNGGGFTSPTSDLTLSDLEITMAVAANPIGSMSGTFASNMTNPVLVRDGAYTLPAFSMPGGSTPNAFGALVSFDTAYTYQGGDLIFMFTRTLVNSAPPLDFATTYTGQNTAYRSVLDSGYHSSTGGVTHWMPVLQFEVIPEPSGAALLVVGLSLIARRRRQSVRRRALAAV